QEWFLIEKRSSLDPSLRKHGFHTGSPDFHPSPRGFHTRSRDPSLSPRDPSLRKHGFHTRSPDFNLSPRDFHPSPRGFHIIARIIARLLTQPARPHDKTSPCRSRAG